MTATAGYLRRLANGVVGAWVGAGLAEARSGSSTNASGSWRLFAAVFALGLAAGMAVNGRLRRHSAPLARGRSASDAARVDADDHGTRR